MRNGHAHSKELLVRIYVELDRPIRRTYGEIGAQFGLSKNSICGIAWRRNHPGYDPHAGLNLVGKSAHKWDDSKFIERWGQRRGKKK